MLFCHCIYNSAYFAGAGRQSRQGLILLAGKTIAQKGFVHVYTLFLSPDFGPGANDSEFVATILQALDQILTPENTAFLKVNKVKGYSLSKNLLSAQDLLKNGILRLGTSVDENQAVLNLFFN